MRGRFLFVGDTKLWIRGVTYGTFRPDGARREYPAGARLESDLAGIAAAGFNAIRTYSVPPRDVLDAAWCHGVRVLVGLPWEQHVAFLDDPERAASIVARVREAVRSHAGHPAVLAWTIGNEIPAPIVRWHGRRAIERFLAQLATAVRDEDPGALVTYVNYPTTEYLDLPFIDLVCFNVYLERASRLEAYLARLHNLAGDRPLLLTEIGLDSRRHGELAQARALEWQVRAAFRSGCSGAFVFAWTDEWHRGGFDVDDWDFGVTDRARRPKPALAIVRHTMANVPFPAERAWPRVSVVVCSYNGARTIRDTLDGLRALDYPDYEVIVVDDGSTDTTAAIAREYPVRVISTPNRGLSAARNLGLVMATGAVVAYIDDDAFPDPHWLHYLVVALVDGRAAGAGGPNLPPPDDGFIADAVARAPGGPTHVLVDDAVAEHVPGCNMAFWKSKLEAIGGFDPRFRTAGDDVDVCWRIRDRGWKLAFSAAAIVWHHRRNSVRTYWRQQKGYGRAEALLERKWPERYNAAGHAGWEGRLYGGGRSLFGRFRERVYQGTWGTAPFQSVYQPAAGLLGSLSAMPEWYLLAALLAVLSLLGLGWRPLDLVAVPTLVVVVGASIAHAASAAATVPLPSRLVDKGARARMRLLIALLHLAQPAARLHGRLRHGLTLWRVHGPRSWTFPSARVFTTWSERWRAPEARLEGLEQMLRTQGFVVSRGGDWDRWDLEIRAGALGGARVRMATEEHGAGRQLSRFRVWPRVTIGAVVAIVLTATVAYAAAVDGAPFAAALAALTTAVILLATVRSCGAAVEATELAGEAIDVEPFEVEAPPEEEVEARGV